MKIVGWFGSGWGSVSYSYRIDMQQGQWELLFSQKFIKLYRLTSLCDAGKNLPIACVIGVNNNCSSDFEMEY